MYNSRELNDEMPPPETVQVISISDDEDDHGAVSKDLETLEKKINEVNEEVAEFNADVASYKKLLKAAEDRLQRSRDQKERLVGEKSKLVGRRQRLQQRRERRARSRAIKAQSSDIRSTLTTTSLTAATAGLAPAATSAPADSGALGCQTIGDQTATAAEVRDTIVIGGRKSTDIVGRAATASRNIESRFRAVRSQPTRSEATKSQTPESRATESRATESRATESRATESRATESRATESRATESRATESRATESQTTENRTITAPSGPGSGFRASADQAAEGGIDTSPGDFRRGSRAIGVPGRTSQLKASRVYTPYYEASNSDSEEPTTVPGLAPGDHLQVNIPADPKTFSRLEISSLIGGKTQGTWCNVNPNRIGYKGSYISLVRDLNHLLPTAPGLNGGVYVGDWLKKEVGKIYHIFIKKTNNNWLYYGKYLISFIREVSLDEWREFSQDDKNRWAEHLLEHQWGKNILVKKKVFQSAENLNVRSHWREVLKFFNQPDDLPHLRLKLLGLHFTAYDRDLYDSLESQILNKTRN